MAFLDSRGFYLGAKGRLYSKLIFGVMLYGRKAWQVKEDVIRLERNVVRDITSMHNIRTEDRISIEKLGIRLKLKCIRECLQDRRVQWLGRLERMEENVWSCKYRTRKTWNDVFKVI